MRRHRATDDDPQTHLPLEDESVDALAPSVRKQLARQWSARATAELRVASVFSVLARDLFEHGADPAVIRICARAVSDEVRHADICRVLAERYGGEAVAFPEPAPVPIPDLADARPGLRSTLHVIAMGCINETVASAWLEASLTATSSSLARAALRELIADDIHHARLGWAHLGSAHVTPSMRAEIGPWLGRLLDAVLDPWLVNIASFAAGVPSHGVPSEETSRAALAECLDGVVLPGLEALGVDTSAGRAWRARRLGQ